MRRILQSAGVLFCAALGSTCGGGPMPVMGTLNYSWGCRAATDTNGVMHPPCAGAADSLSGTPNTGDPPLTVNCFINQVNGQYRVRFLIDRTNTTPDQGTGFLVCGTVGGGGQDMTNGTVSIYLMGDGSVNNSVPGTCHVHINNLGTDSFDGHLDCTDAPDSLVPSRYLYISGIATGPNMTTDPTKADFSFSQCSTAPTSCPSH